MLTLHDLTRKIQRLFERIYQRRFGDEGVKRKATRPTWGASYSVFDGEELLECSLRSIREETSYINVVYQTKSWYGNPCSSELLEVLNRCYASGLIDELIEFVPDLSKTPSTLEREKRNIGLQHAIRAGCNYFMTMDCDEFFIQDEMIQAKKFIVDNGITTSYVLQIKYSYTPRHRQLDYVAFVGFFCAINSASVLGRPDEHAPWKVDPTRIVSPPARGARYYVLKNISMHHMELVRKDIQRKMKNSSWKEGGGTWQLPPHGPDENDKVIKGNYAVVEDRFNIKI